MGIKSLVSLGLAGAEIFFLMTSPPLALVCIFAAAFALIGYGIVEVFDMGKLLKKFRNRQNNDGGPKT